MIETLTAFPPCPVCASGNTALRARFASEKFDVSLYYCLDCESFASPDATPWKSGPAVDWHNSVEARNRGFARELFDAVGIDRPVLLDIGCGTGTLIGVAAERGGGGIGFDTDASAVEAGRAKGLDLHCRLWTPAEDTPAPTLITCIMVLEHLHQPRPLMRDMAAAARRHGCPVFVSVPWFERAWWPYLQRSPSAEGFHPLRDPHIHVTHFSARGFRAAMESFGATEFRWIGGGWSGFLVGFGGPEGA